MTQEQKELLLKDLSARLPYGVLIQEDYLVDDEMFLPDEETDRLINIDVSDGTLMTNGGSFYHIDEVRPYLFPLLSMTEKQKFEINLLSKEECDIIEYIVNNPNPNNVGFPVITYYMVDWCNKNHFDYRGLIEKGLALDATGLNIY